MEGHEKDFLSVQEEFLELDHDSHLVNISLQYAKPDDIIDSTVISKTPLLKQEFFERITRAFDNVPDSYRLNIHVFFDSFGNYSEEELSEISRKNILLETGAQISRNKNQNKLALSLCGAGLFFILVSIFMNLYWTEETALKEVIAFILDIAATVPLWSAADLYFVSERGKRKQAVNMHRRFSGISFHEKNKQPGNRKELSQ